MIKNCKQSQGGIMNKSILNSILKPAENPEVFKEIMDKLSDDPKTSWYSSAGDDYRDLIYLTGNTFASPELFIHNDYHNRYVEKIEKGDLGRVKGFKIRVVKKVKCDLSNEVNYEINRRLVDFPHEMFRTPLCYLLNVEISKKDTEPTERVVLYFFMENTNFFKEIVIKRMLRVTHLTVIRDGSGCGGGGHVNMKFLEHFLGYMGTEIYVTDNFGRRKVGWELVKDDKVISDAFELQKNRPVSYEGVGKIKWSNYGLFLGDALIFKTMKYDEE